jgi:hypothetical protein
MKGLAALLWKLAVGVGAVVLIGGALYLLYAWARRRLRQRCQRRHDEEHDIVSGRQLTA